MKGVQEQPKAGAREAWIIDYSVPLVLSLKTERHIVRRLVLETKLKGQGDSESKGDIIYWFVSSYLHKQ